MSMAPFINQLRFHLATKSAEADDLRSRGYSAPRLTPEMVEREIRKTPELRVLYSKLTPDQRAYVFTRHVLNTPGKISTHGEDNWLTDLSKLSPLEHDYQLVNNTDRYIANRALQSGVLRAYGGGKDVDEGISGDFFGSSLVGGLASRIEKGLTGKGGSADADRDLNTIRHGGVSTQSGANELVAQPLTAGQKATIRSAEYITPTAIDVLALRGLSLKAKAAHMGTLRAAAAGSRVAKGAAPVTKALSKTLGFVDMFNNPVDFTYGLAKNLIKHPARTVKAGWGHAANIAKGGWNTVKLPFSVLKHPLTSAAKAYDIIRHPARTAKAASPYVNTALNVLNLGSEVVPAVSAYGQVADMRPDETLALRDDIAASEYLNSKYPTQNSNDSATDSSGSDNTSNNSDPQNKPKAIWNKEDTSYTAASAFAGGTLGAILARRNRLLGFLLGSIAAGGATAAYRSYKNRNV